MNTLFKPVYETFHFNIFNGPSQRCCGRNHEEARLAAALTWPQQMWIVAPFKRDGRAFTSPPHPPPN
jgi:hypothetical protein